MGWTRNDSLAFDAVMRAGEQVRGMYDKYQAGQAYQEGAGLGAVDASEYDKYAAQFAETNPEAADAYRNAAGLVRSGETKVPTAQERRASGLSRQADFYYGRGDTDKGAELEARGLQMEASRDQLARGKRTDAKLASQDRADEEIANWRQFGANREAAGSREMAAIREQYPEVYDRYYKPGAEAAGIEAAATRAYGAQQGLAMGKAARDLSEESEFNKLAKALTGGKKGIFDWYEKDLPDGWNVKEVKNKDGSYSAVQYKTEGGKEVLGKPMVSYKNDLDLQMQVAAMSPKLVPEILKLKQKQASDEQTAAIWDKRLAAMTAKAGASAQQPKVTTINVPDPNNPSKMIKQTIQVVRDGNALKGLTLGGKEIPQDVFERGIDGGDGEVTDQHTYDYRTRRAGVLSAKPSELSWEGVGPNGKPRMLTGEAARTELLKELDAGYSAETSFRQAKTEFDGMAEHDRNSAVLQAVRDADSQLQSPQARSTYLQRLGVTPQEADTVRKLLRQNGARVGIPRRAQGEQPPVGANPHTPGSAAYFTWQNANDPENGTSIYN